MGPRLIAVVLLALSACPSEETSTVSSGGGPGDPAIVRHHRSGGCGLASGGHYVIVPRWEESESSYQLRMGPHQRAIDACDEGELVVDSDASRLAYRCGEERSWIPIYKRQSALVEAAELAFNGDAEDFDWLDVPSWDEAVTSIEPAGATAEERRVFEEVVGVMVEERDPRAIPLLAASATNVTPAFDVDAWCDVAIPSERDESWEARLTLELVEAVKERGVEVIESVRGCRIYLRVSEHFVENDAELARQMLLAGAAQGSEADFCEFAERIAVTPELRAHYLREMFELFQADLPSDQHSAIRRRTGLCPTTTAQVEWLTTTDQLAAMDLLLRLRDTNPGQIWCEQLGLTTWSTEAANRFASQVASELREQNHVSADAARPLRCDSVAPVLRAATDESSVFNTLEGVGKLSQLPDWWCELVREQPQTTATELLAGESDRCPGA